MLAEHTFPVLVMFTHPEAISAQEMTLMETTGSARKKGVWGRVRTMVEFRMRVERKAEEERHMARGLQEGRGLS